MTRQRIDTTYADLRPTDLVIDKSGQAWPIAGLVGSLSDMTASLWLCDPVTKIKMHHIEKQLGDSVTVSRVPTQADEAARLEADFDATKGRLRTSPEEEAELQQRFPKSDWAPAGTVNDSFLSMEEAIAAVEAGKDRAQAVVEEMLAGEVEVVVTAELPEHVTTVFSAETVESTTPEARRAAESSGQSAETMQAAMDIVSEQLGGTVEAVVTAEEVDAAHAATDDEPVQLPPFADMDILQMRSHLFLLHGVLAYDMKSRQETIAMHDQAHVDHDAGKLNSRYIPHVHEVK